MIKTIEDKIINKALNILESRIRKPSAYISNPDDARKFVTLKLAEREYEVFAALFLTVRHGVIEYNEMFRGTLDQTSVHPREIAKRALEVNAGAVIFAHNHPSGENTPSDADRKITAKLKSALDYFDVRVLDHLIVGQTTIYSFSEHGLL